MNISYPAALVVFAFACLALSPQARAACQQGCLTNQNTVLGDDALLNITTGDSNTANGALALYNNTSGRYNTATGDQALFYNRTGNYNTATGRDALYNNTGSSNTATGVNALYSNTTGYSNTANGVSALLSNTTGRYNTATGDQALAVNETGQSNTATGVFALFNNSTGNYNTANGLSALISNTTGSSNTANGVSALANNTTGRNNIALGYRAGKNLTTGSNNIDIGATGVSGEESTTRIGIQGTQTKTFVAGISGSPIGGTSVVVNAFGRLGTVASSQRFKDDIKPMDKASEAILMLEPVTFRYKKEIDAERTPQFGLVAENVEKVNPDLVVKDAEGKVYTVRYEAVNAMLLNEFLKEHKKVEQLQATVAQQEKDFQAIVERQQKQIEALAAGLQKVNAQLELTKAAPQTVLNDQ